MKLPARYWPETLPPERTLVFGLIVVYLLFGLVDHDPWRIDDVVNLAIAHSMNSEQWLIPQLAGEPWLTSPPLYHWLAALLGNGLTAIVPWHAGARLSSAIALGGGVYALAIAARHLYGPEAARIAPLLAVSTLGLLVPAHEAQPSLTSFLAIAWQLAALSQWERRPVAASIALGLALGIGFLGSGLSSLFPMLGLLVAATLHPRWRLSNRTGWIIALLIATPLIAAWPLALANQDLSLVQRWWDSELLSLGGNTAMSTKRLELLAWAAWPVLPLGLWQLWLVRKRLTDARNFIAFAGLAITLIFFLRSSEPAHALLPMLAMLTLIAAPAAGQLRRGAANAFDWFGAMSLTLFMALTWLGGVAIFTGMPARVAKNFTKPAPGFVPEWSWFAFAAAVLATLIWIRLLVSAPRSPWRAASRWSLGVILSWVLLAALWLPWIDYGKTYRSVSADLRRELGDSPGCIERRGLDEAHRASLDFFDGIRTQPINRHADDRNPCTYRIVQAAPKSERYLAGWTLVLDRARPADRKETLRLYRRNE